jgi:hypothetical protein
LPFISISATANNIAKRLHAPAATLQDSISPRRAASSLPGLVVRRKSWQARPVRNYHYLLSWEPHSSNVISIEYILLALPAAATRAPLKMAVLLQVFLGLCFFVTASFCYRETLLEYAINEVGLRAFNQLLSGLSVPCESGECIFDDVLLSYPLKSPIVTVGDGTGNDDKVMIQPQFVRKPCIVYGIGIANNCQFEESLSNDCETHAFDCTISAEEAHVKDKKFAFHPVCIGPRNEGIAHNVYGLKGAGKHLETQMTKFQTLHKTMYLLGHKQIDIFKMDIEGGEWTV